MRVLWTLAVARGTVAGREQPPTWPFRRAGHDPVGWHQRAYACVYAIYI